ncbi:chemotaxis protein CheB [Lysobacter antibioticus]|uniref:chemotaxis protein CheB n=1 Tax=Lysobacter antibioticus TaxID=84531 RepID=UPI0011402518
MAEADRRVALLARAGVARDRLRSALGDAGANLVLEGDPTSLEPSELDTADPDVVVVVLDPAIEDALDRFENLLVDPSIEVIFEEAELTVAREGWDAARWARHLSAKLHRHDDVLPPGREPEPEPEPMFSAEAFQRPSSPASAMAQDEQGIGFDPASSEMPHDPSAFIAAEQIGELSRLAPAPRASEAAVEEAPAAEPPGEFDIGRLTLEAIETQAAVPGQAASYPAEPEWNVDEHTPVADTPLALDDIGDIAAWQPPDHRLDDELIDLDRKFADAGTSIELEEDAHSTPSASGAIAPIEFDDGRGGGAETPAFESSFDFDFATDPLPVDKAAAPPPPAVPDWSFADEASLIGAASGQSPAPVAPGVDAHDLEEIERRISGLELVDDRAPVSTRSGAVLVLAGIGGPDAVRQLLGALPENFGRPVLVQQRLDGGRYDRLVAQMQRATPVLVKLAEPGARTIDGVIYILPAGVGVDAGDSGIQFVEDGGEVMDALPAADSAILLFSGADPAQVDTAMKLAAHGALVLGQAPDGCYDAAAASAAIARGAGQGQPSELAAKLAARWSTHSPL